MEIKSHFIGKVINSKNLSQVLGLVFCVIWKGKKVYITSSDVVPSKENLIKRVVSLFQPDIMFEDSFGNIASMRLVKSEAIISYMGNVGSHTNIAVFEMYGEQKFHMEPLELSKQSQGKTVRASLLEYQDSVVVGKKCKILCNDEGGFVQVQEAGVMLKGAPIIAPRARKLLGFYSSANFNNNRKTLKAGKVEDVSTQTDFEYHGRVTTPEVIRKILYSLYGPDDEGTIAF